LATGNALLAAAINAERAIGALVLIGIGATAAIALLAYPAARAAIADPRMLMVLIAAPLLLQIIAGLFTLRRLGWWQSLRGEGNATPGAAELRYFAGFLGMNLALTAANVATMLLVRATIVHVEGLAVAGLFAAGWGIGMQSMALVLSSFGTYVLPTLAASSADERRKHLQDAATLVLCASVPLVIGLIVFKPLVIRALFSAQFLPAISLLQWLFIGNYFKGISWVMAIPLLAAADLRRYFVLEIGWFAVFAPITLLGIDNGYGIDSAGFAFVIAYAAYLTAGAWFTRSRFGFIMSRRSTLLFSGGAVLIGVCAVATWNDQTVNWLVALPACVAGCVAALFGLTPRQRGLALSLLRIGGRP
jgi:PST family polysaccharide transporter